MSEQALRAVLLFAVRNGVSDIHLRAGKAPKFRRNGTLMSQKGAPVITDEMMRSFLTLTLGEAFPAEPADDFRALVMYGVDTGHRFRVHAFRRTGDFYLVIRVHDAQPRSITELHLPPVLETVIERGPGLVLVTGPTGSGRTTTMASMLDHINETQSCHIVTLERPAEYVLEEKRAIVTTREVGRDTPSFAAGVREALQQDPDVILVSEMPDLDTRAAVLLAAEMGHLVIAPMPTRTATETVRRFVAAFPPAEQRAVRVTLAQQLVCIFSQQLVNRKDGKGRVPASEVLIGTEWIRDILSEEIRLSELRDAIARGKDSYGMQTFDQSLLDLFRWGLVSYEEALRECVTPSDFALKVTSISTMSDGT
jgi:twitching motility protein PilT